MADTISPQDLASLLQQQNISLLDVRRRTDKEADPRSIPGAVWRDPEQVAEWAGELPQDKPVVLYCVRGGSVSKSVQAALREKRIDARFLEGGLTAWLERKE